MAFIREPSAAKGANIVRRFEFSRDLPRVRNDRCNLASIQTIGSVQYGAVQLRGKILTQSEHPLACVGSIHRCGSVGSIHRRGQDSNLSTSLRLVSFLISESSASAQRVKFARILLYGQKEANGALEKSAELRSAKIKKWDYRTMLRCNLDFSLAFKRSTRSSVVDLI